MKTTASTFVSDLTKVWSCLDFAGELRDYATPVITRAPRKGVALLSLVALLFLGLVPLAPGEAAA
jgi:hypothetical protein